MTNQQPFQRRTKIGIIGGGQLGRMLAEAAHDFELQTVVYCQSPFEPAAQIATQVIVGHWSDEGAIEAFATSGIRWVVGEWENVEPSLIDQVGKHVEVFTMADVLRIGRSRRKEKNLADDCGVETVRWLNFDTLGTNGTPFDGMDWEYWSEDLIVKIDNGGYDGKGQWSFDSQWELMDHPWAQEKSKEFIIEERIDLGYECSVLVERNAAGLTHVSPVVRNRHTNIHGGGILEYTYWKPGAVLKTIEIEAQQAALDIANKLELVGVIAVEFFVTKDGKLLFNELAPRVHNSFHGTIEATAFSQFHRHVAAVTGLSLPEMKFERPWIMVNLIGEQINLAPKLIALGWSVHGYGKTTVKKARKMGHATLVLPKGKRLGEAVQELKELELVECLADI